MVKQPTKFNIVNLEDIEIDGYFKQYENYEDFLSLLINGDIITLFNDLTTSDTADTSRLEFKVKEKGVMATLDDNNLHVENKANCSFFVINRIPRSKTVTSRPRLGKKSLKITNGNGDLLYKYCIHFKSKPARSNIIKDKNNEFMGKLARKMLKGKETKKDMGKFREIEKKMTQKQTVKLFEETLKKTKGIEEIKNVVTKLRQGKSNNNYKKYFLVAVINVIYGLDERINFPLNKYKKFM